MTRKRNRPAAVTFDAGNTLLYCDPSPSEIYATQLSRLGRPVHAEEVGPVFRQAWTEMQRRTSPGRDRYNSVPGGERAWWGEFVKEILGQLDHDAPWEPLLDDLYAAFSDDGVWRVFPETAATLSELRTRGLALAIISNWDCRLPDILRSLDLIDLFEAVTVSAIEGVEKPSQEIFQRTSNRLGVDPSSILHVGDSPLEDYSGARNAGFAAALIDRHDLFADEPYQRISSLDEVLSIIDG
jgi:REG-2-like HAD superfamily hydrolase